MKLKKLMRYSLIAALTVGSIGAISGCNNDNKEPVKGEKGDKGDPGNDAIAPKVRINNDNYWEISTDNGLTWTSTGVKATGSNGEDGHTPVITIGQNGNWYVDGVDSTIKAQGEKGNDAIAPKVQINKITNEWEVSIDGGVTWTPTGVKATGEDGQDLVAKEVTVTYNFNLGNINLVDEITNYDLFVTDGFEVSDLSYEDNNLTFKMAQKVHKGDYFDLYDYFGELPIGEYFDGWYVGDIKVNGLNVVASNIELTARWKKDFATLIDGNVYSHSYRYNNSDMTAIVYPTEENTVLRLRDFKIHEGKFYKVTDFSVYKDGQTVNIDENSQIYARAVYLSDSLSDSIIGVGDSFLPMNYHSGKGKVAFYTNNAYHDTANSTMVYTIKDYAILGLGNEYTNLRGDTNSRMQYLYKIDYTTNTAKLIQSYRHPMYAIDDNPTEILGDIPLQFNVLKDGVVQNVQVTELSAGWFTPSVHFSSERETYYGFLVGTIDDDKLAVSRNFLSYTGEEPENIGYNLEKYKCALFLKGEKEQYEEIDHENYTTIFYYSEEEPTEEGNYWHYHPTNSLKPVVWGEE